MSTTVLHDAAEQALALMRAQGFDHAQVTASLTTQDEVNIANNEPSLLRSTEVRRLSLLGLFDGRKASTELSEFDAEAVRQRIAGLHADASSAPQDAAKRCRAGNARSSCRDRSRATSGCSPTRRPSCSPFARARRRA